MKRRIKFEITVDTCEGDIELMELIREFKDKALAINGIFVCKGEEEKIK